MELSEIHKNYVIEIGLLPLSEETRAQYKSVLNKFLSENERCYRMSELELKQYFSDFRTKRNYSDSYYNVICSSVKILYEKVLKQPRKMNWFHPIKTIKTFKDIITYDEYRIMMGATKNLKHRTEIIILFSTGIRIGELLNIKIQDIDFANKRIFINSEKRGKNRYVQLHEKAENHIKAYLDKYKPKEFLFEGQFGGKYSETSIRHTLKKVSSEISKNIYPHLFRTTYISKVIEKENVFKAKELAGHQCLNSTLHYYHIPKDQLAQMYNPLDN